MGVVKRKMENVAGRKRYDVAALIKK